MSGAFNCLLAAIGVPLALFLTGYGVYLSATGRADYGVFLLVIAALLYAALGSGFVQERARARRRPAEGKPSKRRK
jgi:hypothetical protein